MARPRNIGIILALVIVGCGSSAPLIASSEPHTEPEETLAYIGDVFRSAVGSPPGLGWVLPDGTVVTAENLEEITVLAATPKVVAAPHNSTVSAESSIQFIEAHHVACDFLNLFCKPASTEAQSTSVCSSAPFSRTNCWISGVPTDEVGNGRGVEALATEGTGTAAEILLSNAK